MKNWILEDEITALICCDDIVYFYKTSEKQTVINKIKKNYKLSTDPYILLLNNKDSEFKLKLKNGVLFVNSKNLPDPNKFYTIGNYNKQFLLTIIEESTCISGDIDGKFEIVFSKNDEGECFPVSSTMNTWKTIISEQKRRLFASYNSKTTKHKPGHRYDSDSISILYLGEFFVRHELDNYRYIIEKFFSTSTEKVQLFTTDINTKYKTISDVIANKRFLPIIKSPDELLELKEEKDDDYVVAVVKLPAMVDAGEVLKDDIKQIPQNDLINRCLDTYMNNNKCQDYPQYNSPLYYNNIKELYSIFSYCGNNSALTPDATITNKLKNIIEADLNRLTQIIPRRGRTDAKTISNTYIEHLLSCCNANCRFLFGSNYFDDSFAKALFSFYSINLIDISLDITNKFLKELPDYNKDLDSLIQHISYYLTCGRLNSNGIYYFSSSTLKNNVEEVIDKNFKINLADVLKNILKASDQNNHKFCNTYEVKNIGFVKKPVLKTLIKIDIFDIFNFYGGQENLPIEVKNEIVETPFVEIILEYI